MRLTSGIPGRPAVWHLADMSIEERKRLYGSGYYEPLLPVVAGDFVTLTFHFEIGETSIPRGGRLRIAWRWPFDWAELQSHAPGANGFMVSSVSTSQPDVSVEADFQQYGELDPWMHHIDLTVTSGQLIQGDRLKLICGQRSGGGSGWRAPTFVAKSTAFLMLINPDNSDRWLRLPDAPAFSILPGSPARLVVIAPAGGVVDRWLDILVRAEDCWGNPTAISGGPSQIIIEPLDHAEISAAAVVSDDPAVYRVSARFELAGSYRLIASVADTTLAAESNPLRINTSRPSLQLFWGDLHSGQTDIACGAGSLSEHYTYARDVAGLQFTSQQANDHYLSLADWKHVRQVTQAFDEPGRFAAFLGCEWSPLTKDGGDRNVIYRYDEPTLRRSGRYFTESDPDPEPDLPTAPEFLAVMKNEPVLINMHVGGRPTNLDYHQPEIEPLAEIHSTHATSEWFVNDALQRGYKIGITGGTDGVMGRPGACAPGSRVTRNVRSGLTAVYASTLSQESLWEAFHARRCYATDGERIRLWVEVDGHAMGEAYRGHGSPQINISIEGTAPIERVELLRGTNVLCCWHIAPVTQSSATGVRLLWGGAAKRGTARDQRVIWNGRLHVTAGRFLAVRPVGFHSCQDEVQLEDSSQISWRSVTAGNDAGFVMTLDGDESTVCHLVTDPCSIDFTLSQIARAPLVVDAAGLGRYVSIGPAPAEDGPRQVELAYRDTQPLLGEWPYWVRVVQINQAKAWSSPVYVTTIFNQNEDGK